ncbi:hypothetical protein A2215_04250 [Candidatus Berkelbacteria bacterium RIFOXYA2_FULL_43_10]|uniref:Uncharacterized protein n=1 Tax=Candidatus Berkelbacteria bacterium RIFOXYA2_FULL_43_10 TaxID=1797472 RepID=A0A1F5EA52_9BACT|nr:MAG: hypothetical protein A2215_04250 [Candidatus Berkelbacteria bacterium RIFOXYA2_FULL_43_10]
MGGRGGMIHHKLVYPLLPSCEPHPKVVAERWHQDDNDEDFDQAPSGNPAKAVPDRVELVEDEEREHQIDQCNCA